MGLKNCKRCGKLFSFQSYTVCQQCLGKEEEDFHKIRDYMRAHPGVTLLELSRETGVEPAVITRFRREGRLASEDFNEESAAAGMACESCGVPIYQGRYCNKCISRLSSELTQASREMKNRAEIKKHAKIHTLDSFHKKR